MLVCNVVTCILYAASPSDDDSCSFLSLFFRWVCHTFFISLSVRPGNLAAIADHLKKKRQVTLGSRQVYRNCFFFFVLVKRCIETVYIHLLQQGWKQIETRMHNALSLVLSLCVAQGQEQPQTRGVQDTVKQTCFRRGIFANPKRRAEHGKE